MRAGFNQNSLVMCLYSLLVGLSFSTHTQTHTHRHTYTLTLSSKIKAMTDVAKGIVGIGQSNEKWLKINHGVINNRFMCKVQLENPQTLTMQELFYAASVKCVPTFWIDTYWYTKHDDVVNWKHFLRYWPFVRGIHRYPVNFPHKCQWRGAKMFSFVCAWMNDWVNNGEAGDLRHHRAQYDVTLMHKSKLVPRPPLLSLPSVKSYLTISYCSICVRWFLSIHHRRCLLEFRKWDNHNGLNIYKGFRRGWRMLHTIEYVRRWRI